MASKNMLKLRPTWQLITLFVSMPIFNACSENDFRQNSGYGTAPKGNVSVESSYSAPAARPPHNAKPVPTPSLTSITPGFGLNSQATPVTIVGQGFAAGDTLSINHVKLTGIRVVSDSIIEAVFPAQPGVVGFAPVAISNTKQQGVQADTIFSYATAYTEFDIKRYTTGLSLAFILLADMNGDKNTDFVVTHRDHSVISVFLGNGSGGITRAVNAPVSHPGAFGFVSADFDSDGMPDIALTHHGARQVEVLFGDKNKTGGFTSRKSYDVGAAPAGIAAADFNHDGHFDLVVTDDQRNTAIVLLGDGAGGFTPLGEFNVGKSPYAVSVYDMDNKNGPDILVANIDGNSVSILLNDGEGSFVPGITVAAGLSPYAVEALHLNDDKYLDIVTTNTASGSVGVFLSDGKGGFSAMKEYAVGMLPATITVADFNNDLQSDLAIGDLSAGSMTVMLGDGKGGLRCLLPILAGDNLSTVVAGFVDHDARVDLVSADISTSQIDVLLNQSY